MFKKYTALILICLLMGIITYGCAKQVETEQESLYYKGIGDDLFAKKKYKNAVDAYQNALMRAESPEAASKIQLSLANAYFLSKQYIDSIPVYEVYLDYYGNTPEADIAILRIAMAHFKLMRRPSQDQTETLTALKYFNEIKQRNPEMANANDVDKRIYDINQRLAEKEYIIGRYYGRILKHRPEMLRYKYLVDNYPESARYELALSRVIRLMLRFDETSDADTYFAIFKSKYPNSKYMEDVIKAYAKNTEEHKQKTEELNKTSSDNTTK